MRWFDGHLSGSPYVHILLKLVVLICKEASYKDSFESNGIHMYDELVGVLTGSLTFSVDACW